MSDIKFIEKQLEDRFEYHLPVSFAGFLRNSIFDNPFLLDTEIIEEFNVFLWENGISCFATRENTILYSLVLKLFSENNSCYLIYFDEEKTIGQMQTNFKSEKCEWSYAIEFTDDDVNCRTFGFQNPSEFLEAVNYSNKDLTSRYYYISKIEPANLNKYIKLYVSDVTNWFFIFCPITDGEVIKNYFTSKNERPYLESVLKHSSYIVNVQVGEDEGYLDYLLIQTKSRINISEIERKMNYFTMEYEKLIDELKVIDEAWKVEFYKERYLEIIKNCG